MGEERGKEAAGGYIEKGRKIEYEKGFDASIRPFLYECNDDTRIPRQTFLCTYIFPLQRHMAANIS
jgi:hypothetical protein